MSPPSPFSDLQEAHKLTQGAVAGLIRTVDHRMDRLEKKQQDHAVTADSRDTALWDAVNDLRKDVASTTAAQTKLASAVADLSKRITSIQSDTTRVGRMVTALGEPYGDKCAEMNRDIQEIKKALPTIRQEQSALQTQVARQQQYHDGMDTLSAAFALTELAVTPTNNSLPPLGCPSLPRAVSLGIEDGIQIFQPPARHAVSGIGRSSSERQSDSPDSELHHQRSGSLQRKRGRSDLRKASRESVRE